MCNLYTMKLARDEVQGLLSATGSSAGAVRTTLRASGAPARPDGVAARGARSHGDRGRFGGRDRGASEAQPRETAPQVDRSRAGRQDASRSRRTCRAERVVVPGPTACTCCGSDRLAKIGEDVTETLEVVPRQWKVESRWVREKFTCRGLREHRSGTDTVPRRGPWLGRPQSAGDGPFREVRPASALSR